ncbi:MAG TPA: S9 family peptidase [Streptosporangiaceae bacterium]|nr:S9 family peptidase [Streptosporangiaceae bacterium]
MTPFDDLRSYLAIPRLTGLRLAPDGTWLAATVQQPDPDGKKFSSAIWRIPADLGPVAAPPTRLTQSALGEDSPVFLPDGSLLFISRRPDPAAGAADKNGDDPRPALWLLPAGGGEARRIAAPPGGVSQVATARGGPDLVFMSPMLAGAAGEEDDASRRQQRKDAGVTAILHEAAPVRFWDHDLGPDEPRLMTATAANGGLAGPPRDLTPQPGRALDEQSADLAPDGSVAVTGWAVWDGTGDMREELTVIDTATGDRRVLLTEPGRDFSEPHISPDGRLVVCAAVTHDTYDRPGEATLVAVPLAGGEPVDLMAGMDRRPGEAAWAPDSQAVYFTADDHGRCPVFRAGLTGAPVTRFTTDDGAYSTLCPSPDGRYLYALRSAIDSPPAPVRLDLSLPGGPPQFLPSPAGPVELPGRLTELEATADDGAVIRGWLALPASASEQHPAPLLLWVHGGPRMSWNAWSWRWNPWLMVAHGYAVLLPDPGLSTGYGHDFVARGHGDWGERPFADLMAVTDAAAARPDIDAERTAAMGGSYGGYMANWIAGHTDRFRAIVSHAGLWALDQMFGTTDMPAYWRRHFGDPLTRADRYRAASPHYHLAAIRTPMLVIHGDKDYRVPVGEALRLWSELISRPNGSPDVKFLYFPTENHWILTPGHAAVWYEAVLAFLATHVRGEPWQRPNLL